MADTRSGDTAMASSGRRVREPLYVSVDMGSSSVKIRTASVDADGTLVVQGERRIPHRPTLIDDVMQWTVVDTALQALRQIVDESPGHHLVVSLDAWGSDIVFLDENLQRVGPIRSYLDPRLDHAWQEVQQRGLVELAAQKTGGVIRRGSTLTQLVTLQMEPPAWLPQVHHVVPIVDYVAYLLTGTLTSGISISSSTSLLNPRSGQVDRTLLDSAGVVPDWFADPVVENHIVGPARMPGDSHDFGTLVKVAGHDTASALRAGYGDSRGRPFASLGSWSVVGTVVAKEDVQQLPMVDVPGFTHEFTGNGQLRINKDVPGMRALQMLEREWFDTEPSQAQRTSYIPAAVPWEDDYVIDVHGFEELLSGSATTWLAQSCRQHGLAADSQAELALQALRSIAHGVATAVSAMDSAGILDRSATLWTCSGGANSAALTRWVNELTGFDVVSGPDDASALGGLAGAASLVFETPVTLNANPT